MKNYKSVQCVGFSLNTGMYFNQYVGLKDDNEDAKMRVEIMKDAIEKAKVSQTINKSADCLKVFMAPEFFFRGIRGAYELQTCTKIVEQLRETVKKPEYDDWLFVFGTAVGYAKRTDLKIDRNEAYNYAFIQKGNRDESESFVVMKEHRSHIDFLDTIYTDAPKEYTRINRHNTFYLLPTKLNEERNEIKVKNYDSNGIFDVDGIRFAVEICLDHLFDRIGENRLPKDKDVDVHLVTSCGVLNPVFGDRLKKNALGFLCDGSSSPDSKVHNHEIKALRCIDLIKFEINKLTRFYSSNKCEIKIFETHDLRKEKTRDIERII